MCHLPDFTQCSWCLPGFTDKQLHCLSSANPAQQAPAGAGFSQCHRSDVCGQQHNDPRMRPISFGSTALLQRWNHSLGRAVSKPTIPAQPRAWRVPRMAQGSAIIHALPVTQKHSAHSHAEQAASVLPSSSAGNHVSARCPTRLGPHIAHTKRSASGLFSVQFSFTSG